MTLKITVLLENRKRKNSLLAARSGLSLLIQANESTILFDTGPDDSFYQNAMSMNIDLKKTDAVVLSHGHYDHCGGVPSLPCNTKIICHPSIANVRYAALNLLGRYRQIKKLSLDIDYSRHQMLFTKSPLEINKSLIWSGEIAVSSPAVYGALDENTPDVVIDEGVLIYKHHRGLVIITGCGHRGLEEIIKHCQSITGINKVYALIGGFHLRCASPMKIIKTRKMLSTYNVEKIYGCHCTGLWGRLWLPQTASPRTGDVMVL